MPLNDVKVDTHDLRHPLGAVEYVEYLQMKTREMLHHQNGIDEMIAFIAITKNPMTGVAYPHVSLTVVSTNMFGLTDSGPDKQMFSGLIKQLARKSEALMICIISEAWTIKAETEADILLAKQWIDTHDGIEDCPLRQDSVIIQVEHKALSPRHQIWTAPIHTVGEKRAVGAFQNQPNSDDGRFCNLLPD